MWQEHEVYEHIFEQALSSEFTDRGTLNSLRAARRILIFCCQNLKKHKPVSFLFHSHYLFSKPLKLQNESFPSAFAHLVIWGPSAVETLILFSWLPRYITLELFICSRSKSSGSECACQYFTSINTRQSGSQDQTVRNLIQNVTTKTNSKCEVHHQDHTQP